ncbi:MAG: hypothetical protein KDK36_19470 [Leptospiraceae bacterium]|nr:hypothetical protein [Leptospiraceae bacterium]
MGIIAKPFILFFILNTQCPYGPARDTCIENLKNNYPYYDGNCFDVILFNQNSLSCANDINCNKAIDSPYLAEEQKRILDKRYQKFKSNPKRQIPREIAKKDLYYK